MQRVKDRIRAAICGLVLWSMPKEVRGHLMGQAEFNSKIGQSLHKIAHAGLLMDQRIDALERRRFQQGAPNGGVADQMTMQLLSVAEGADAYHQDRKAEGANAYRVAAHFVKQAERSHRLDFLDQARRFVLRAAGAWALAASTSEDDGTEVVLDSIRDDLVTIANALNMPEVGNLEPAEQVAS